MTLLVIHLTDAHLDGTSRDFVSRASEMCRAALSPLIQVRDVHIVFSGDLANKTAPDDFKVAEELVYQLSDEIEKRLQKRPRLIISAGNHDCDFSGDQSVRNVLLQHARSNPTDITGEVLEQISAPLVGFYEVQRRLCPELEPVNRWWGTYTDHENCVRYVVLNSAVMSVLREDPGKLYVPVPHIEPEDDFRTIVVMHHPYGWLMPDNARELAQAVAVFGDIFLMGHEHELWAQQVSDLYEDTAITYLRGHVLRDPHNSQNSAFQTIHIDLDNGFLPKSYEWRDGKYVEWEQKSKDEFLPWPVVSGRRISFSTSGFKALSSSGANYTHRRKESVTLQDIFVWPDLKAITPERDTGSIVDDGLGLSAERLLDTETMSSLCVIKGGEQSGKSALAKMLTMQLAKRGFHPLLMDASAVSSWRPKALEERIDRVVDELYGRRWREHYNHTNHEDKVLLLDDFDIGAKGALQGLKVLRQHFERIYIFLDSYPGVDIALSEFLRDDGFFDSSVYEILPTAHHRRLEIIEKWLTIGSGGEADRDLVKLTAARLLKVVDETLGRNLLPAAPIFVLIILQRAELAQDLTAVVKNGSHGFLYESLITQALSGKVTVCNVVTSLAFLTAFARSLDVLGVSELSEVDYERFHVSHCQKYDLSLTVGGLLGQLVDGDILDVYNGTVKFKYPYHYYYFVARALSQEDWSSLERRVDGLVGSIHTEKSANILLFLAHLGRNPKIAEKILVSAGEMFGAYEEADLFGNRAILERYKPLEIRQVLVEGTRAQQLAERESDEEHAENASRELAKAAEDRLKSRLDDALHMNAAFKTLQVLGQVLRNHSGEIERDDKRRLAGECVSLGLRVLGFLIEALEENAQEMLLFRSLQLKAEKGRSMNDAELAEELVRYLPSLLSSLTVGTIIKIANAIGSEDLSLTIDEVLSGSATRKLIRLAAHLEHFSDFPTKDLMDFEEDVLRRGPVLPNSVLRRFIIRRFYLFPVRDELKRSVLDRFKIRALPFQFLAQKRITHQGS
jgi:nicotinamide riboside kinase